MAAEVNIGIVVVTACDHIIWIPLGSLFPPLQHPPGNPGLQRVYRSLPGPLSAGPHLHGGLASVRGLSLAGVDDRRLQNNTDGEHQGLQRDSLASPEAYSDLAVAYPFLIHAIALGATDRAVAQAWRSIQ